MKMENNFSSTSSSHQHEYGDETVVNTTKNVDIHYTSNINKINEYIEKLDMLDNNFDLKITLNQQREKENFINNIDNINIYIKKHMSFKKKLSEINKSFKKNCNYDAFSKIENVYKTISNINSSYEFIILKIKIEDYINKIEENLKINNYIDTIPFLKLFLEIRKNIFKYNSLYFLNHNEKKYEQKFSNFLNDEDKTIQNDITDYVNYKRPFIFQNNLDKKKANEHVQAYTQIYEMNKDKIDLLNRYYNRVKEMIENEIIELIKKKNIENVKDKINIYLSLFTTQNKKNFENKTDSIDSPLNNTDKKNNSKEMLFKENVNNKKSDNSNYSSNESDKNNEKHEEKYDDKNRNIENNLLKDKKDEESDNNTLYKCNKIENKNDLDNYLIYYDEYLFVCIVIYTLVEIEIDKIIDLLKKKIVSKEDNIYIECIKKCYSCLYKYNLYFEKLVKDNLVYIIYNRKIELIYNKIISVIFRTFCSHVKLCINSFDELKDYDKNIEILSLLCYNFVNIKIYLHDLYNNKFQKLNNIFDIKNYINTNIYSNTNGIYKNIPYISIIQDSICSYIDHEILFSRHCINKAFILTDDIMLSLIDDENNKIIEPFNKNISTYNDEVYSINSAGNNNEYTSTFLEDSFFIFQKSVCRSINMNDINIICVLINNIMIIISTTLKEYLKDNIKTSKSIYSSFIHDINNLKKFSFKKLLKSIDNNNYTENSKNNKTVQIAQNFVTSLSYISSENNNDDDKKSNFHNYNAIDISNNSYTTHYGQTIASDNLFTGQSTNHTKIIDNIKIDDIYNYLSQNNYNNLYNPLNNNQDNNIENQIINSKFSYPHCINNIEACYQYIQKYKIFIHDYFSERFLQNDVSQKKKTQNYLLMFNNALTNYDNILNDYEKLNIENCKNLLNILKIHFVSQLVVIENINFDISSEQYSYYQLNDPYIHNLIVKIKLILHHISLYFNQNIFHIIVNMLAEKICKYIERIIMTKKFSLYGCVQIDNDIRNLMLFFTSVTSINIKKEFLKLLEICELLNINDLQDFKDFYDENKNNLSTNEIENIISLRNDIPDDFLKSIKLYMNLKI
ncbi:conserved Plasmodium protein, unknown function [Plasmodium berghei]|uniref:Conserved oligomeric Golgi complex subunit 4 C-terminal domain-containing protein n=1 Tax=Plasmodium berghei TaxID=5821 RepID=A0A1D3SF65_PLABE|nr:conserved Plasmodium protein, unknown function [Plasmodium berghei]